MVTRKLNVMIAPLKRFLLVALLIIFSGCSVLRETVYLDPANQQSTSGMGIFALDNSQLLVSLPSKTRDQNKVTVISNESVLTDAQGQKYTLEFRPNETANKLIRENTQGQYAPKLDYFMFAYGPLPTTQKHSFLHPPYTLSVVYLEDGQKNVETAKFTFQKKVVTIFDWVSKGNE